MRGHPSGALTFGLLATFAASITLSACGGSDDVGFEGAGGDATTSTGASTIPAGKCSRGHSDACAGTCIAADDVACYEVLTPETTCLNDPECAGTEGGVCVFIERTCGGGVPKNVCAKGCVVEADCPPTQTCGADGHCRRKTCGACDASFICGGEGNCVRLACQADGDCPGDGYCVNGLCHEELGTCVDN